jgi:1,4-alpha-glucan branching enzyme
VPPLHVVAASRVRVGLSVALLSSLSIPGCNAPIEDSSESASALGSLRASLHGGMGATLYDGGVGFRIFAPFARRIWVAGDFNGWSPDANELGSELNGNFSADVPGAQRWQKYKYFIEAAGGSRFWKADPRAGRMENSSASSIVHDPGAYQWSAEFRAPGFDDMVFYEMHIGTFARPGHVGTWRAAVEKLDYLAGLGVNMLEVMPVAEFPGDLSWGYNPSEPMAPESAYGTPEDMKAFVDAAHARGMGVVVDLVMNHWGPNDLPMWCVDGDCLGNGGAYFYTDHRAYTPWGNTRPDYGRREVREYIKDTALMWLQEYRVDGLRWDGTKYMRTLAGDGSGDLPDGFSLMQWINGLSKAQPWKILVAEDFGGADWMSKPAAAGGAAFDSQWDGAFVHPVRAAVTAANDEARSMTSVRDAITHAFNGQATQRVIYTENHDEVANGKQRLPESIWPGNAASWASKKRSTLAAAITFTSPGIPLVFQGQEFLEDGWFSAEDPLDWSKAKRHGGITQLYRDLAHLRRNWNGNTQGLRGDNVNVFHVNDGDKVIAYHRWAGGGPGDDVVVVANFSGRWFQDYRVGMPRSGRWYVRFNSDSNAYSSDFGNTATQDADASGGGADAMAQSASFQLGPYSAVILSQ